MIGWNSAFYDFIPKFGWNATLTYMDKDATHGLVLPLRCVWRVQFLDERFKLPRCKNHVAVAGSSSKWFCEAMVTRRILVES